MPEERSTGWKLMHSLWMLWFLTLGFFNWVAFVYIGVRVRQRRWVLWGLFYSIPLLLFIVIDTSDIESWPVDVATAALLALGVASVLHGFKVRKEYLLRLDARQRQESGHAREELRGVETGTSPQARTERALLLAIR
ncbi:MAG: hypothetical protein H0V53_10445 [Rubrobacter sp.]|nr:hypothetical protein [Rubrobacter sp.]